MTSHLLASALVVACLALPVGAGAPELGAGATLRASGHPKLAGALGGAVSVAPGPTAAESIVVAASLGELSPINTSPVVTLTIPVRVTATGPFHVLVAVDTPRQGAAAALGAADVGFGVVNVRPGEVDRVAEAVTLASGRPLVAGAKAMLAAPGLPGSRRGAASAARRRAARSAAPRRAPDAGTVQVRFAGDPATALRVERGRATFASSLESVGSRAVILADSTRSRAGARAWEFEVVLAVVPQFYAPGDFTINLTVSVVPDDVAAGTK
jgi:hypothetical protein